MYHQFPQRSLWDMDVNEIMAEIQSINPNLTDPSVRLAVITELRKLGYTVEPGGK